jgi:hypothetical protein
MSETTLPIEYPSESYGVVESYPAGSALNQLTEGPYMESDTRIVAPAVDLDVIYAPPATSADPGVAQAQWTPHAQPTATAADNEQLEKLKEKIKQLEMQNESLAAKVEQRDKALETSQRLIGTEKEAAEAELEKFMAETKRIKRTRSSSQD